MSRVLLAAAACNLVWGGLVVLLPRTTLGWIGLPDATYPQLWQCLGMVIGVYGVGYAIAARDPLRHWPIVLVGWLGKVFGPIGFAWGLARGELPWQMSWTILTNDLVWWAPFTLILLEAWKAAQHTAAHDDDFASLHEAMAAPLTNTGESLADMSHASPVLLIFLRHFGCTFCRETVADVSAQKEAIDRTTTRVVFVHMSSFTDADRFFKHFGLESPTNISDPTGRLYRAFSLARMSTVELFDPIVWWRGFCAAILDRHGVGRLQGDGFRKPGVFVIDRGRIRDASRHTRSSDRPDYYAMASRFAREIHHHDGR